MCRPLQELHEVESYHGVESGTKKKKKKISLLFIYFLALYFKTFTLTAVLTIIWKGEGGSIWSEKPVRKLLY